MIAVFFFWIRTCMQQPVFYENVKCWILRYLGKYVLLPLRVKICGRRKRRCQTVAIQGIQSTIQLKASDKNGHMILVTLFLKEYDRENMSRDFCVFRTNGNNYTRLIVPRQLFENRYTRSISTSKKKCYSELFCQLASQLLSVC